MSRNILTAVTLITCLALPVAVLAAPSVSVPVQGNAITLQNIETLVQDVVNFFITIASVAMVAAFVYAGFLWITAGDNEGQVTKAKTMLRNALWGSLIILGVGVILNTIANFATNPTQIVQ